MKRIVPLCLLLAAAMSGQAQGDKNSVEQTLIQMEHDWSRADTEKDAAALDRILADDWIGIDFEGHGPDQAAGIAGHPLRLRFARINRTERHESPDLRQYGDRHRHRYGKERVSRQGQQRQISLDGCVRVP